MNRRIIRFLSAFLAAVMLFCAPSNALAADCVSKYTRSVYTHGAAFGEEYRIYNAIDVSAHNGSVDWDKVKADGIDYAVIRAGFTGYTQSTHSLNTDAYFAQNLRRAAEAGLKLGVYWYSQALNTDEAEAEAQKLLSLIDGCEFDLPVFCDYEFSDSASGRLNFNWSNGTLNKKIMTENIRAFLAVIEQAGFTPGVYSNKDFLENKIDGAALGKEYFVWLAHTAGKTSYNGSYSMWQYSFKGDVNGVQGEADCSFVYIRQDDERSPRPGKVTGIVTSARSDDGSRLRITWNTVDGADGYKVYRLVNGAWIFSGTTADNYMIFNVTPGYEYYYMVQAFADSEDNTGELSDIHHTCASCIPVDKAPKLQSTAKGRLVVNWNTVRCHGYLVQYSKTKDFKNPVSAYVKSQTSYKKTFNNLQSGQRYYARIRNYRFLDDKIVYGPYSPLSSIIVK